MVRVAVAVMLLFFHVSASAQTAGKFAWQDTGQRLKASQAVTPLGPEFSGEQVSLSNGALSFSATDVSLPGNDSLPVEISRSYTVKNRKDYYSEEMFADWSLDLPSISGIFTPNWTVSGAVPTNRCSATTIPDAPGGGYLHSDYWRGLTLELPGGGGGDVLVAKPTIAKPSSGGPYPWVTGDGKTHIACLSSVLNTTGEGFIATTADGTRYWFNWMAQYREPDLNANKVHIPSGTPEFFYVSRRRNVLLATRVEDRFGNAVTYTYANAWNAPAKLTSIQHVTDGRQLTLSYSGSRVASISDGTRTWSYAYGGTPSGRETLTVVTLPDASAWTIGFAAFTNAEIKLNESPGTEPIRSCTNPEIPLNASEEPVGSITHPSGATGTFTVNLQKHGRSNVPVSCGRVSTYPAGAAPGTGNNTNDDVNTWANADYSFTLKQKRVSGPGLTTADWTYSYVPGTSNYRYPGTTLQNPVCNWSAYNCAAPVCLSDSCAGSSKTTIVGPEGKWARYTYGNSYLYNEGKLLKVEEGTGETAVLRTAENAYDLSKVDQAYFASYGTSQKPEGDGFTAEYHRPSLQTTLTQDGATFSSSVDQCGAVRCFDGFAQQTSATKSSSLGYSKQESYEYENNTGKWVIGQVKKITVSGIVAAQVGYDPVTANQLTYSAYGKLQQTLTYNADGTVATVKDGNNNVTTLSNWYRSVPRTIQYPATAEAPAGATRTAVVNDKGWITSVTDENGFTTGYGYDAMGRSTSIVYPTGDSTVWNTVTMAFQKINADEHGLPAGHWRQSRYQGNRHVNTYYDALWRPVLEEQLDYVNIAGTLSQTVKRYDVGGRLAFQSYPTTNVGDFNSVTQGSRTSYDALDRVTRVEQDSELGVLASTTVYQAGFQALSTNPRGLQVTTEYQAYDQPTTDFPARITTSADTATEIHRDVFQKPTLLVRRNHANTQRVERRYVYDSYQQLCKTIEPETGATVMGYDGAGNLTHSWSGLALPATNSCNGDEAWQSGRLTWRRYTARNQVDALRFADGHGDQNITYTPDGLPDTITTWNGPGGDGPVVNAYSYNKRRLLTGESVQQTGWYTWGIGYGYDANGSLATQSYPTGFSVNYAPNALGQATQAGTYATGVQYYPNGGIKQFTYGNGIVHTMTQNARQLPQRSTDSGGALDLAYSFDANANVNHIWDYAQDSGNGFYGRWMTYDGLDRLTDAGSCSFGGDCWHRFTYDALDNMKSWKLPGVKDYAEYVYDAKNQLTNIKNTAGATVVGLSYDVQGNLANKNGKTYTFDYGNRLRGTNEEWYRYDGHGRRVLNWRATEPGVLSQYSQSGQLLYDENYRASGRKATEYVYLAGSVVAMRERNIDTNVYATKYQHTDALGSPVAVTDAAGAVIDRTNYEPYGAAINKPAYDGIGYTGHVMDGATGLTYMQQRYYDPMIGRFLSVDPVTANSATGANFNRYWYANNNPYKFTDPDGRQASICEKTPQRCNAVIQVGPPSVRSGDNEPRTTLTDRPVQGNLNRRDPKTSTADGGYDPTGAKRLRSNGARKHHGIDIGSEPGTPVVAAAAGTAQNKSNPGGYGIYVDIQHGQGLSTRYAHLESSSVENGQFVSGGDEVGKVGRTGNLSPLTQAHLHFEVRRDGVPQDPLRWFEYDYD